MSNNTLKIGQMNVRKKSQLTELVVLAKSKGFDILLLSDVTPSGSLNGNDTPYIHNLNGFFDAAIIILNTNIEFSIINTKPSLVHILLTELNLHIKSVYIRPRESGLNTFDDLISEVRSTNDKTLISGDVNARHRSVGDKLTDNRGEELLNNIITHGWTIINQTTEPSFSAAQGTSLVDWSFISHQVEEATTSCIDPDFDGMSDHRMTSLTFITQINIPTHNTIIPKISTKKFLKEIAIRTKNTNINEWYTHYTDSIKAATFNTEIKARPTYWTPELIKTKNRLNKEKYKINKQKLPTDSTQSLHWQEANKLFKALLKQAIEEHYETELRTEKDIYSKLRAQKTDHLKSLSIEGVITTDGKQIAQHVLSNFFPSDTEHPTSTITTDTPDEEPFTMIELKRALDTFGPGKAPGEDGISSITLKAWFNQDNEYMLELMNHWYLNKIFPAQMKDTKIILIRKQQNNDHTVKNTRPIGLLNVISKIYEKLLDNRLKYHLFKNNIIVNNQHGFRPQHSCIDPLNEILRNIKQNRGKFTSVISMDIAGAFNNITHLSIIKALARTNWHKNNIEIIKSYFTDRTVSITVNKIKTTWPMNRGVVQGSKLSPTLFILGINGAIDALNKLAEAHKDSCEILVTAYADDVSIVITNVNSHRENETWAQLCFATFSQELKLLGLELQTQKTQLLNVDPITLDLPFILNNQTIKSTTTIKILGVIFDKNITFEPHLKYVINKTNSTVNKLSSFIYRYKRRDRTIYKKIIISVIATKISYASSIWLNNSMNAPLRQLNKTLLNMVTGAWRTSGYASSIVLLPTLPIFWLTKIQARRETAVYEGKFNDKRIIRRNFDYTKFYHPKYTHDIKQAGFITTAGQLSQLLTNLSFFTDGSKYHED